jgi:phosphohistidine phosphatase
MAKKPEFMFKQAGALPYRRHGERVEIVLITSRSSGKWSLPKGIIDPGETPETTAVKEAFEESGVIGQLTGGALGCFEQEKWGGVARVEIYPLLVDKLLDDWDERGTRDRLVVSLDEARLILGDRIGAIIDVFENFLQSHQQYWIGC